MPRNLSIIDQAVAGPAWMTKALHDLSQPLTALECILAISIMSAEQPGGQDANEMEDAIRSALLQCDRMLKQVRAIQTRLHESS